MPTASGNVRVRGQSGKHVLVLSSSYRLVPYAIWCPIHCLRAQGSFQIRLAPIGDDLPYRTSLSDSSFYFPFAFSPGSAVASTVFAISRSAIANEKCVYRIGFDVVANRDVGKPSGDMPLDGFCKRFLCGFCGHRQRMIEAVVDGWRRWRLCYDPWFWPRPRPLWRIDVEMLGTI